MCHQQLRCSVMVCILKLHHCPWLQVEKSPAVLKKGMKKEDAEALKKKLEAGELQC